MAKTKDDVLLDYAGLAKKLGITLDSARTYNTRSRANRRMAEAENDQNYSSTSDLPEADRYFGQSPSWLETTIDEWMKNRPGQGNHG